MQRRRGRMLAQGLGLAAAFGVLIALPQTAAEGVRSGLTLCGQVILPSLFPFFVCSNLFVLLGFSARVSARFGGLAARLLRLPPNAGSAFVIGMTGGYPAGAQAVGLLYKRGELSRDEAEHALAVCNQAGPSFIFGYLGGAVFAHPGAGALLCGRNTSERSVWQGWALPLLGALLFCMLPTLWERAFRHTALASQWLILFALYFYLEYRQALAAGREPFPWQFPLLAFAAVGIHPYFLPPVMVCALLAAVERGSAT